MNGTAGHELVSNCYIGVIGNWNSVYYPFITANYSTNGTDESLTNNGSVKVTGIP